LETKKYLNASIYKLGYTFCENKTNKEMKEKKYTFDNFVRIIITIAVVWCIVILARKLSGVLLPFVIGLLIAYILHPIVSFFQYKLRMRSRIIAIICTFIVVGLCLYGLYELIIPPLIDEFTKVSKLAMQYFTVGSRTATLPETIHKYVINNLDIRTVNRIFSQENIVNAVKNIIPKIVSVLSQSIDIVIGIVASLVTLLYVVFILLDYEAFSNGWYKLVPFKYRSTVHTICTDATTSMNKYFRGQSLIAIIVAILSCIGFLIINLPMAIGLGILVGICTMIPYMKFIALIPGVILALLKAADTGENVWIILLTMFAVFAVVQLIEDTLLTPNIMGKITGLPPAIILLALSVWGCLLGILGMIIALPITSLLYSYYKNFVNNSTDRPEDSELVHTVNKIIGTPQVEKEDVKEDRDDSQQKK
jgi:predicted PurR-regulated permease PerM